MERLAPEQHDSLDGVPEPAEQPQLVGHRAALDALAAAYRAGKLPHALLVVGPRGIGKATMAFHLANHLLRHPDSRTAPPEVAPPDIASSVFRQVASGAHPGVLHLTRPANDRTKAFKAAITVDEVRRINRFLSLTSADGTYRIVIVDPVDDMNINASNALLKNLEEPPSRTLFVLIANSLGRVLPTIRSRCQIVRLNPLRGEELDQALAAAGVAIPDDDGQLADLAGGSVRQAILLAQLGGLEIARALETIVRAPSPSAVEMHRLADAVAGRDRSAQFDLFNEFVLDLLDGEARRAAEAGDLQRSSRFSRTWQDLRIAMDEAATYNLDRKQHALNMIFRLNDTFRM